MNWFTYIVKCESHWRACEIEDKVEAFALGVSHTVLQATADAFDFHGSIKQNMKRERREEKYWLDF